MLRRYWTTACHNQTCALKARCTPGKESRISRWEHEAVLETVQAVRQSWIPHGRQQQLTINISTDLAQSRERDKFRSQAGVAHDAGDALAGEKLLADWAGDSIAVVDPATGKEGFRAKPTA